MVQSMGPNKGAIARCHHILMKLWQWNTACDIDDKGKLPRTGQSQTISGALQFNKPYVWHQGGSHLICWLANLHNCFLERCGEHGQAFLAGLSRTEPGSGEAHRGSAPRYTCGCQCWDTVPWVGSQSWSCGSLVPAPANTAKPWFLFIHNHKAPAMSYAVGLKSVSV